jgi:glycerophosphoryl diester phosphodiesterase
MAKDGGPPDKVGTSYAQMASAEGLKAVAAYADGVGVEKAMVIPRTMLGALAQPTSLVADAHAAGLKVHIWTMRRENYFLPLNFRSGVNPAGRGDLVAEIQAYLAAGVDGFFTDNVAEGVAAMK